MDWDRILADFGTEEGSLRGLYVHRTSLADWQQVLDFLRNWTPTPSFTLDGEPRDPPEWVEEIFCWCPEQSPLLSLAVGGVTLHCGFRSEDAIGFDLDASDVTSPAHVTALTSFMSMLGELTGRGVSLREEGLYKQNIFHY